MISTDILRSRGRTPVGGAHSQSWDERWCPPQNCAVLLNEISISQLLLRGHCRLPTVQEQIHMSWLLEVPNIYFGGTVRSAVCERSASLELRSLPVKVSL